MALGTRNFILTMWSCEGIRQKLASRGSLGGNFKYGCLNECQRQQPSYRAIYQLSHECVHALKPVKLGDATVLEEGLATEYSIVANEEEFRCWLCDERQLKTNRKYRSFVRAYEAVRSLREIVDDLDILLKEIRRDGQLGYLRYFTRYISFFNSNARSR